MPIDAWTGVPGEPFASIDKALDERTIGHNPERLCLLKVCRAAYILHAAMKASRC